MMKIENGFQNFHKILVNLKSKKNQRGLYSDYFPLFNLTHTEDHFRVSISIVVVFKVKK